MAKKNQWKPGNMIYPLPAVLVSCGRVPEEYNLFTVAWTGTLCTNPPMCYISVRPERHSMDTGASSTMGAATTPAGAGVSPISSNLRQSLPDFTPHQSVA